METKSFIRRATKADRNGILSIIPSGEYDGDYLHDYFNMLMDDPLYNWVSLEFGIPAVSLSVGHAAISIIDDGITGVLRGARTSKEHQAKGFMRQMHSEVLQQYPMVKYFVNARANNLTKFYEYVKQIGGKIIATRKCVFYSGSKDGIADISEDTNTLSSTILQVTDLQQMFQNRKSYPSVFNEDRLVIDSIPNRIMEPNAKVILSERTRAVVTASDNRDQTLLTFGSFFRQPNGELFCKIDMYGAIGESLQIHVLRHIQIAMKTVTDMKDVFTVELRSNAQSEKFDKIMGKIGLQNSSIGTSRRTDVACAEHSHSSQSKL